MHALHYNTLHQHIYTSHIDVTLLVIHICIYFITACNGPEIQQLAPIQSL